MLNVTRKEPLTPFVLQAHAKIQEDDRFLAEHSVLFSTGDGALRWRKRSNRPNPTRIQYLVPFTGKEGRA